MPIVSIPAQLFCTSSRNAKCISHLSCGFLPYEAGGTSGECRTGVFWDEADVVEAETFDVGVGGDSR